MRWLLVCLSELSDMLAQTLFSENGWRDVDLHKHIISTERSRGRAQDIGVEVGNNQIQKAGIAIDRSLGGKVFVCARVIPPKRLYFIY